MSSVAASDPGPGPALKEEGLNEVSFRDEESCRANLGYSDQVGSGQSLSPKSQDARSLALANHLAQADATPSQSSDAGDKLDLEYHDATKILTVPSVPSVPSLPAFDEIKAEDTEKGKSYDDTSSQSKRSQPSAVELQFRISSEGVLTVDTDRLAGLLADRVLERLLPEVRFTLHECHHLVSRNAEEQRSTPRQWTHTTGDLELPVRNSLQPNLQRSCISDPISEQGYPSRSTIASTGRTASKSLPALVPKRERALETEGEPKRDRRPSDGGAMVQARSLGGLMGTSVPKRDRRPSDGGAMVQAQSLGGRSKMAALSSAESEIERCISPMPMKDSDQRQLRNQRCSLRTIEHMLGEDILDGLGRPQANRKGSDEDMPARAITPPGKSSVTARSGFRKWTGMGRERSQSIVQALSQSGSQADAATHNLDSDRHSSDDPRSESSRYDNQLEARDSRNSVSSGSAFSPFNSAESAETGHEGRGSDCRSRGSSATLATVQRAAASLDGQKRPSTFTQRSSDVSGATEPTGNAHARRPSQSGAPVFGNGAITPRSRPSSTCPSIVSVHLGRQDSVGSNESASIRETQAAASADNVSGSPKAAASTDNMRRPSTRSDDKASVILVSGGESMAVPGVPGSSDDNPADTGEEPSRKESDTDILPVPLTFLSERQLESADNASMHDRSERSTQSCPGPSEYEWKKTITTRSAMAARSGGMHSPEPDLQSDHSDTVVTMAGSKRNTVDDSPGGLSSMPAASRGLAFAKIWSTVSKTISKKNSQNSGGVGGDHEVLYASGRSSPHRGDHDNTGGVMPCGATYSNYTLDPLAASKVTTKTDSAPSHLSAGSESPRVQRHTLIFDDTTVRQRIETELTQEVSTKSWGANKSRKKTGSVKRNSATSERRGSWASVFSNDSQESGIDAGCLSGQNSQCSSHGSANLAFTLNGQQSHAVSMAVSPFCLRVCGILPWTTKGSPALIHTQTQEFTACGCWRIVASRTWYQWLVLSFVLAVLSFHIYQVAEPEGFDDVGPALLGPVRDDDRGTAWGSLRLALASSHRSRLLSDVPLATGSLIGLLQIGALWNRGIIGFREALLVRYAMSKEAIFDNWSRQSMRDRSKLALIWCIMVLFRALTAGEIHVQSVLGLFAFTITSGILIAVLYSISHVSRAMTSIIDNFILETVTDFGGEDIINHEFICRKAVHSWNIVQATLRKCCYAIEHCFAASITCGLVSVLMPFLMSDKWHTAVPGVLYSLAIVVVASNAGEITSKCDRAPAIINSLERGETQFNALRQFMVTHMVNSLAGFYLLDVRLTNAMVVKTAYFSAVIVFSLITQLHSWRETA